MAIVKMTNQEFPIPDSWVALPDDTQEAKVSRDARLKRLLGTYIPAITNARLNYTQNGEQTIVSVVPQLGTKGTEAPEASVLPASFFTSSFHCDFGQTLSTLHSLPPFQPSVLTLAWQFKLLQLNGQLNFQRLAPHHSVIREALRKHADRSLVEMFHARLKAVPPVPAPAAPLGF